MVAGVVGVAGVAIATATDGKVWCAAIWCAHAAVCFLALALLFGLPINHSSGDTLSQVQEPLSAMVAQAIDSESAELSRLRHIEKYYVWVVGITGLSPLVSWFSW